MFHSSLAIKEDAYFAFVNAFKMLDGNFKISKKKKGAFQSNTLKMGMVIISLSIVFVKTVALSISVNQTPVDAF